MTTISEVDDASHPIATRVGLFLKKEYMQATAPILKKKLQTLHKAYIDVIARFSPEDIHVFRVEAKKLRAFLRLTEGRRDGKVEGRWGGKEKETRKGKEERGRGKKEGGGGWKVKGGLRTGAGTSAGPRLPKRLRAFYRTVGTIRNLDMQQQRIRENWKDKQGLPEEYLGLLKADMAVAMRKAVSFARNKISFPVEKERLLSCTAAPLRKKAIRDFVRKTAWSLEDWVGRSSPIRDEDLHEVRKLLKALLYNQAYISIEDRFLLPVGLAGEKTTGLLKSLTEELGRFQDLCIGVALLGESYMDRVGDEQEKWALMELQEKWVKEKAAGKDRLRGQIIGILYPAKQPGAVPPATAVPEKTKTELK